MLIWLIPRIMHISACRSSPQPTCTFGTGLQETGALGGIIHKVLHACRCVCRLPSCLTQQQLIEHAPPSPSLYMIRSGSQVYAVHRGD